MQLNQDLASKLFWAASIYSITYMVWGALVIMLQNSSSLCFEFRGALVFRHTVRFDYTGQACKDGVQLW